MVNTSVLAQRPAAAPDTPTVPSKLLLTLISIPSGALAVSLLPYYIGKYCVVRPGVPFRTWIIASILRVLGQCMPQLPSPETHKMRWNIPKTLGGGSKVATKRVDVPPAPESLLGAYAAIPASSDVTPLEMPGFLLGDEGPASPGECIILYFHGGAYIRGHPLWTALPSTLAKDLSVRVFGGQYRKCITSDTAFPGPLLDALAAWNYVTATLGFEPSRVIIAGDSAGGHLCLALLQQLAALDAPLPGAAALISPWADFTFSFPSWKTNTYDYLGLKKLDVCAKSCARYYTPEAVAGPFFSPALAPAGHWKFLEHKTTFLISEGTAEVFFDEDEALIAGLQRDGVTVHVQKVSTSWTSLTAGRECSACRADPRPRTEDQDGGIHEVPGWGGAAAQGH